MQNKNLVQTTIHLKKLFFEVLIFLKKSRYWLFFFVQTQNGLIIFKKRDVNRLSFFCLLPGKP